MSAMDAMRDTPKPGGRFTDLEGLGDAVKGDGGTGNIGGPVAIALTHANADPHRATSTRPPSPACPTDRTPPCGQSPPSPARVRASPPRPRSPRPRLEARLPARA